MALIKSSNAVKIKNEAVVLDLGDLRRQAVALQEEAKSKADAILEQAQQGLTESRQEAHDQGYQEGFDLGYAEGMQAGKVQAASEVKEEKQAELQYLCDEWRAALTHWEIHREQLMSHARQRLLDLAVQMASGIIQRVPKINPAVIVDQLEAAMGSVVRQSDVRIVIHPEDRSVLEELLPQFISACQLVNHAELVEDQNVTPGGCLIQYGQGTIDATLPTQINRMVTALLPESPVTVPASSKNSDADQAVHGDQNKERAVDQTPSSLFGDHLEQLDDGSETAS